MKRSVTSFLNSGVTLILVYFISGCSLPYFWIMESLVSLSYPVWVWSLFEPDLIISSFGFYLLPMFLKTFSVRKFGWRALSIYSSSDSLISGISSLIFLLQLSFFFLLSSLAPFAVSFFEFYFFSWFNLLFLSFSLFSMVSFLSFLSFFFSFLSSYYLFSILLFLSFLSLQPLFLFILFTW